MSEQELKNKIHHRHKVSEQLCLHLKLMCRVGQKWFTVVSTQNTEFILVLLFLYHGIIFHMNNYKPTFASPCIYTHTHMCSYIQLISIFVYVLYFVVERYVTAIQHNS